MVPVISLDTNGVLNLMEFIKAQHGAISSIIADNGTAFVSGNSKNYLEKNKIKRRKISVYNPQSNAQFEKLNHLIKSVSFKMAYENPTVPWKHLVMRKRIKKHKGEPYLDGPFIISAVLINDSYKLMDLGKRIICFL